MGMFPVRETSTCDDLILAILWDALSENRYPQAIVLSMSGDAIAVALISGNADGHVSLASQGHIVKTHKFRNQIRANDF